MRIIVRLVYHDEVIEQEVAEVDGSPPIFADLWAETIREDIKVQWEELPEEGAHGEEEEERMERRR